MFTALKLRCYCIFVIIIKLNVFLILHYVFVCFLNIALNNTCALCMWPNLMSPAFRHTLFETFVKLDQWFQIHFISHHTREKDHSTCESMPKQNWNMVPTWYTDDNTYISNLDIVKVNIFIFFQKNNYVYITSCGRNIAMQNFSLLNCIDWLFILGHWYAIEELLCPFNQSRATMLVVDFCILWLG